MFFRRTRELEHLFFLSRKGLKKIPECNIRLYDKNSESDYIFFPPPKSEYWESEYFFRKNPYPPPPPPPWKLNGPSLTDARYATFNISSLPCEPHSTIALFVRKSLTPGVDTIT